MAHIGALGESRAGGQATGPGAAGWRMWGQEWVEAILQWLLLSHERESEYVGVTAEDLRGERR